MVEKEDADPVCKRAPITYLFKYHEAEVQDCQVLQGLSSGLRHLQESEENDWLWSLCGWRCFKPFKSGAFRLKIGLIRTAGGSLESCRHDASIVRDCGDPESLKDRSVRQLYNRVAFRYTI